MAPFRGWNLSDQILEEFWSSPVCDWTENWLFKPVESLRFEEGDDLGIPSMTLAKGHSYHCNNSSENNEFGPSQLDRGMRHFMSWQRWWFLSSKIAAMWWSWWFLSRKMALPCGFCLMNLGKSRLLVSNNHETAAVGWLKTSLRLQSSQGLADNELEATN